MPSECQDSSSERDLRPHLRAIQGEGPATGRRCAFVRLAICSLRCGWCDTPYTWAFSAPIAAHHQSHKVYDYTEEVHEMSVSDVVSQAIFCASGANLVVLSGGEPLAQVPVLMQRPKTTIEESLGDPVGLLVSTLLEAGISTHIETAGIRRPSPFLHEVVERYVVSPKLSTSGNSLDARRKIEVLQFFANTNKADFKFVVTRPEDFSEISQIAALCKIPSWRIWVMPQGVSAAELQQSRNFTAERALRAGYNYSDRLHILIWGESRGH